jgi:hypothetical protein
MKQTFMAFCVASLSFVYVLWAAGLVHLSGYAEKGLIQVSPPAAANNLTIAF